MNPGHHPTRGHTSLQFFAQTKLSVQEGSCTPATGTTLGNYISQRQRDTICAISIPFPLLFFHLSLPIHISITLFLKVLILR